MAGGPAWTAATFGLFPSSLLVRYAHAADDYEADGLDVERAYAKPADGPAWQRGHMALTGTPGFLYCSGSLLAAVTAAMRAASLPWRLWFAHQTGVRHDYVFDVGGVNICAATQWAGTAAGNTPYPGCDVSSVADVMGLIGRAVPLAAAPA